MAEKIFLSIIPKLVCLVSLGLLPKGFLEAARVYIARRLGRGSGNEAVTRS